MRDFLRKLASLARRERIDADLAEEIRLHVEERAEELHARGISAADARLQARREFGPVARARQEGREAWRFQWIEDLIADLGYALRGARRNPGFAAAAVLSLALAIGVNSIVFSLTTEFLLSAPSARNASEIYFVQLGGNSHQEYRAYEFLRGAGIEPELAGIREAGSVNWRDGAETRRLFPFLVTRNYFEVVGVPVAMGRGIRADDEAVAVVSHRFWQSSLMGDPAALGRSLVLNGRPHLVVGVLTPVHRTLMGFGLAPDLYVPILKPNHRVMLVARAPGMSRVQLADRMKAATLALDKAHPRGGGGNWSGNIEVRGVDGLDRLGLASELQAVGAFFAILAVPVVLVLLIACFNVSGMLLARGAARRHEIAIREAIGAARGRLVRQMLAESLLLAMAGAAAGLVLNFWVCQLLNRIPFPLPVPVRLTIEPDWRLLLYSAALTTFAAVLSGLLPALRSTRGTLTPALQSGGRQSADGRFSLRGALVCTQIAVSTVLLAAGFLFLRSLFASASMDLGFDTERTVWASVSVPRERLEHDSAHLFVTEAIRKLAALPGVEAAAQAAVVPFNDNMTRGLEILRDTSELPIRVSYAANFVSPGYFQAMNIPILAGRTFAESDRPDARLAVVNENFARRVFGGVNAVGRRFWNSTGNRADGHLVIGVARNSKHMTLGEQDVLAMYTLQSPRYRGERVDFLLRAAGDPDALLRPAWRTLLKHEPSAAVEVKRLKDALGFAMLPSQVGAALFATIGALGLLLAAVGLYGVVAYTVARRTREIGVRMALGAAHGRIVAGVFRDSARLLAIGAGAGVAIAFFVTQPLAAFLVAGVRPADPGNYIVVVAALGLATLAATLKPALDAMRVDPMRALRQD